MEYWKDIPGFEGQYQASNLGRIKSLSKTYKTGRGYFRTVPDRIISGKKLNKKGYKRVRINNVTYQVHRLVAVTFLGIPHIHSDKNQVNHINGIKTDNRIENLEWVTNQENRDHAVKNKLIAFDKKCSNTKYPKELIIEIRNLYSTGISQYKLSKMFNINKRYISKIVRFKTRTQFSDEEQ